MNPMQQWLALLFKAGMFWNISMANAMYVGLASVRYPKAPSPPISSDKQ
jgi:hypothetical protein